MTGPGPPAPAAGAGLMEYRDYYATLGVPRTARKQTSRRRSASSPASTTRM